MQKGDQKASLVLIYVWNWNHPSLAIWGNEDPLRHPEHPFCMQTAIWVVNIADLSNGLKILISIKANL